MMVGHPVSFDFDENSMDIELTLDVTEEVGAILNGVKYKKKGREFESLSTNDENTTNALNNDLSINNKIIETVIKERKSDSVEVEATSFNSVSQSCSEITAPKKSDSSTDDMTDSCVVENHISHSSAKVNGYSSVRSSNDDIPQQNFNRNKSFKSSSTFRKFLGNGSLKNIWKSDSERRERLTEGQKSVSEETTKSSTDLPIVDSRDKSHHHPFSECRVNGDIPKICDDEFVSPAVVKRKLVVNSEDYALCPEKRSKIYDPGSSSSCLVNSANIDNSVVANDYSDCENSISSVASNSVQQKKKTTARKSTGGNARKIIARLLEEDCTKKQTADADDLIVSVEDDVDNSTTDFVDVNAPSDEGKQSPVDEGRQSPVDERRLSSVDGERQSPVDKKCQSPINEDRLSPADSGQLSPINKNCRSLVDEGRMSPVDAVNQSLVNLEKYPSKFTRESMSNESLKNVFKKSIKQLSRRQLEEIVLQKCCEIVSESSEIGEMKKRITEYEETETFRKNRTHCLEKQLYQLKAVGEVFCGTARQLKENDKIPSPKIITRSVGLQVDLRASFEPDSLATRANSTDAGDLTAPSAVMNNQIIYNSNTGQSSSCSLPTTSSRPSISEIANTGQSRKPSLPIDNSSANSKSNTIMSVEKNSSSETPAKVLPAPNENVIVDLTDMDDIADSPPRPLSTTLKNGLSISRLRQPSELPVAPRHPAPLPSTPKSRIIPGAKLPPPKPNLSIQKIKLAIQMTWDLILNADYEPIDKYQIYAYQEIAHLPVTVTLWKLVGDVESLDLPMACTLTQFVKGHTYHFAVRAVDKHGRHGPFSCARSVTL